LALTLWTVRVACLCYGAALAAWWLGRNARARVLWVAGFAAYLAHVAAAFTYVHHWSHDAAYRETARQTGEMFGVWWGGGLWFNYVFTAVWGFDALWLLLRPRSYEQRPRWMGALVHGFLAFMVFNATAVFGHGAVRWLGLAAAVVAAVALSRYGRQALRYRRHTGTGSRS